MKGFDWMVRQIYGIRDVFAGGVELATSSALDFVGEGVTASYDGATGRIRVNVPGGGGGSGTVLGLSTVKTAYYEASVNQLVRADATGGDFTIKAPTAVGHAGELWGVLRVETSLPVSHVVTIDADDGVNDLGTYALPLAHQCVIMKSDGSTWRIQSTALPYSLPSDATPAGVGTVGHAGTSQALSRDDHAHALGYSAVQSAIATASSPLGLNSQRITSLADPSSAQDAATKAYVDASAGAYVPTDLAGLTLWLRGDLGVTLTGSDLATWADQSGHGNHFASVAGHRPTVAAAAVNGHDAIAFSAAGAQYLLGPALSAILSQTTQHTILAVFYAHTIDAQGGQNYVNPTIFADDASSVGLYLHDTPTVLSQVYSGGVSRAVSAPIALDTWTLAVARHHLQYLYVSTDGGDENVDATADAVPSLTGTVAIGRDGYPDGNASARYLDGKLAELIIYDRALSPRHLSRVVDYLARRYGVTW